MEVPNYLSQQQAIFDIDPLKQFRLKLPVSKNMTVTTLFEKLDVTEGQSIRADVFTQMMTKKGRLDTKTSTDEPICIEFKSVRIPLQVPVQFRLLHSSSGQTVLTAKTEHKIGTAHSLKEWAKLEMMNEKSGYSFNGSLRMYCRHPVYSIDFDTYTREKIARISSFVHNGSFKFGYFMCASWLNKKLLDTQLMFETSFAKIRFITSLRYINEGIEILAQRRFGKKLNAAVSLSARHIKYSPDFLCMGALDYAFDSSTQAKLRFGSDLEFGCSLRMKSWNKADIEISGCIPLDSVKESTFGASVSFDLTKE